MTQFPGRITWCNFGTINAEKMDIIDSMDAHELIPSREKMDITHIDSVFPPTRHFEVRQLDRALRLGYAFAQGKLGRRTPIELRVRV